MERLLRSTGEGEKDAKNVESVETGKIIEIGENVTSRGIVDTEEVVQTGEDEMTGIGMEERISLYYWLGKWVLTAAKGVVNV